MDETLMALRQAEYVHVVLNHLPIIGLLAGLMVLVIAIFQKSRATAIAAYSVIFVMSLSVFPVTEFGEKAEDQVESLLDKAGHHWLEEHSARADRAGWIYYVAAGVALGGLVAPRFLPKSAPFFLWATLLIGIAALTAGVWIASAGGKIMHREFRYSVAPEGSSVE